jgi:hypothetical protein
MVNVLTSYTLDCEFDPCRVNPKTIKLIFAASSLRIQHQGATAKTDLHGIRIMYPRGTTCLS